MYYLETSTRTDKKFMVKRYYPTESKIIHFGQKGSSDYTFHKDKTRKERYLKRHEKNEDWNDLNKAGTFSRYILWNKPSIIASIKDMEKIFNIKIIY